MPNLIDCTDAIGVPLVYDRGPDGLGVPYKAGEIRFKGTDKLRKVLVEIGEDFKTIGWLPYIESVLTAGLYVKKPGGHGDGTDIDFDGVVLKGNPLVRRFDNTLHIDVLTYKDTGENYDIIRRDNPYQEIWRSALHSRIKTRLACLLSLRFPEVLTAGYNKAHEDHIHASVAGEVGWRGSRSQVVCLQETLNAWFDIGLKVDGIMGKNTNGAWGGAITRMKLEPDWSKPMEDNWLDFLKMIAFNPPGD